MNDHPVDTATSTTGTGVQPTQPPQVSGPQQRKGSFDPRILILPAIGLFVLFGWWSNRGTTTAEALEAGDCFLMTDAAEIDRLETPDCNEPHDSQIMGKFDVPSTSSTYPDDNDPYWVTVYDRCVDRVDASIVRLAELPVDTTVEIFTPTESGWRMGDRESLCVIYSPGGLEGSFLGTP